MKTNCTTHFHACDCREEMHKEEVEKLNEKLKFVEAQNEELMNSYNSRCIDHKEEIEKLNEIIRIQSEAIEFYADKTKWNGTDTCYASSIAFRDVCEDPNTNEDYAGFGGKRARKAKAEVEKLKEGMK